MGFVFAWVWAGGLFYVLACPGAPFESYLAAYFGAYLDFGAFFSAAKKYIEFALNGENMIFWINLLASIFNN